MYVLPLSSLGNSFLINIFVKISKWLLARHATEAEEVILTSEKTSCLALQTNESSSNLSCTFHFYFRIRFFFSVASPFIQGKGLSEWVEGRSMVTSRVRKSWPPFRLLCLINNTHREGLPNGFTPSTVPPVRPVSIFPLVANSREVRLFPRLEVLLFRPKTVFKR